MGLLEKVKGRFKNRKGESSSAPENDGASATAEPQDGLQSNPPETSLSGSGKALGIEIWSQGLSPVVDIVFLHGLTGHRDGTWTAKGAKAPWPKAFLSTDIPNARIITYGYDADVVNWTSPAGENTVREHGQNLVNDLCDLRTRTNSFERPTLFVAHSLGGLVCQDALLLCVNPRDDAQAGILDSTRGIAFLGTPNAGSDFEKFASGVANIISLSLVKAPNKKILNVLKARSQVLANIKNDFLTLVRRRVENGHSKIELHAFVEEYSVAGTGHRVVTPDSAVIPGYNSTTIPENHMNMTKFSGRDHVGYQRVSGKLMQWVQGLGATSAPLHLGVIHQPTTALPDTQEPMNDPKLGDWTYFDYPKRTSKVTHRPSLISRISDLTTRDSEDSTRVVVLYGMGGQGKTILAEDFCREAEKKHLFLAIFWLDASAEETVKKGLIRVSDLVKSTDQTFESSEERIKFTVQKFAHWNRPWLLVLDNYDKPDHFRNLTSYMPSNPLGSVLITSRNSNLDRLGPTIEVQPMSKEEALQLLYGSAGGIEKFADQEDDAAKIVELLGYLPLAIDQAGAYIQRRANLRLSVFLDEYPDRKKIIWMKAPTVWDYQKVVYTTWEMSFELLDEHEDDRTDKGHILTMLSFLDFRNISQDIFNFPRHLALLPPNVVSANPKWLSSLLEKNGNWDLSKLEELLYDFKELSLLRTFDSRAGRFRLSLHPLVSEWMKYRSDLETKRQCLLEAIIIVNMCLHAKLEALERPLLSVEAEEQVFRHQSACMENLHEIQKEDDSFLSVPVFVEPKVYLEKTNETIISVDEVTKRVQEDTLKVSRAIQRKLDDQDYQARRAMLDWLSPDYSSVPQEQLSIATEGTGKWFLDHPNFQKWIQNKSSLLHYKNNAGTGKTILTSQVIHFLTSTQKDAMVLFSYSDFRRTNERTPRKILSSLLRQALLHLGIIPDRLKQFYRRFQPQNLVPSISDLRILFSEVFEISNKRSFIVIDAIDDFGVSPKDVLGLSMSEWPSNFSFMFTSKPIPFFGWDFAVQIDIEPNQRSIRADIGRFCSTRLKNDRKLRKVINYDTELGNQIQEYVVEMSDGIFLVAKLIMDRISAGDTNVDLREIMQSRQNSTAAPFNKVVTTFFEESMKHLQRQSANERDFAMEVLMWVTFSPRLFRCREIQHALLSNHITSNQATLDKDDLTDFDTIHAVCMGLVYVDEEGDSVSLHQASAQPYFESIKDDLFPNANIIILRSCLRYLSLEPFRSGPCIAENIRERILEYPFAGWASEFWVQYAKEIGNEIESESIDIIIEFLADRDIFNSWVQVLRYIEYEKIKDGSEDVERLSMNLAECNTALEVTRLLQLDLIVRALESRV